MPLRFRPFHPARAYARQSWEHSSDGQSNGLLIRRPRVRAPLFPPQGWFDSNSRHRGPVRRERSSNLRACSQDNNPDSALGDKDAGGPPVKAPAESGAGANRAPVAKLADAADLNPAAERCEGSSPSGRTISRLTLVLAPQGEYLRAACNAAGTIMQMWPSWSMAPPR